MRFKSEGSGSYDGIAEGNQCYTLEAVCIFYLPSSGFKGYKMVGCKFCIGIQVAFNRIRECLAENLICVWLD